MNADDDEQEVQSTEFTAPKLFPPIQQMSVEKIPKSSDRQDEFFKIRTQALTKYDVTTEYDAVGINVASKLKRMDQTQSIYADLLISKVLAQGLLGTLTSESDICEKSAFRPTPLNS